MIAQGVDGRYLFVMRDMNPQSCLSFSSPKSIDALDTQSLQ
jgi:hypothetical protein